MGKLRTMINTLRDLSTQIVSRLLHERLQRQQGPARARDSVPISALIVEHIAEADEVLGHQKGGADDEMLAPPTPTTGEFTSTRVLENGSEPAIPGLFGALSQRFARHRSQAKLEPFMAEKMRANTLDHVNKALGLARQGNAQGARIHARLAETAMETAGEYMSDGEYSQLKETVEARFHSSSSHRDRVP